MKRYLLILFISALFGQSALYAQLGCAAGFSVNDLGNKSFTFAVDSANVNPGATYFWDLGDGTVSSQPTLTHTYNNDGIYQVCLALADSANNCNDIVCESVVVGTNTGTCEAYFTYTHLQGNTFRFLDSSFVQGSGAWYKWDFGNGSTSTSRNPIITLADGAYYVCLTVTDTTANAMCTNTYCDSVIIGSSACSADFTYYVADSLTNEYSFSVKNYDSNLVYLWSTGDGTVYDEPEFTHKFARDGSYNVCLSVRNPATNCSDFQCEQITVLNPNPLCETAFDYQFKSGNKYQFFGRFYGTNFEGFTWDFGNGLTSTQNSPLVELDSGTYVICLTARANSNSQNPCVVTYCDTLEIAPPPCIADFSATHNPSINGYKFEINNWQRTFDYVWDLGDGTVSQDTNFIHIYNQPGTYTVCLTASNPSLNCSDTKCIQITVGNPGNNCFAQFDYEDLGNGQYKFEADQNGGQFFFWDFGDGDSSTVANPVHTFIGAGPFTVCLIAMDSSSCQDIKCKTIQIGGNTNCNAKFEYTRAAAGGFLFEAKYQSNTAFYKWDFGNGNSQAGVGGTQAFNQFAPGAYLVCLDVIDSLNNCIAQFCDTIVTGGTTTCDASFESFELFSGKYRFEAAYNSPTAQYEWDYGDGTTEIRGQVSDHLYTASGTYVVCLVVTDSVNACVKQFCDTLQVGGNAICTSEFEYDWIGFYDYNFEAKYTSPFANYKWEFGDGATVTGSFVVDHSYNGPGSYLVCLSIEDSVNNCFQQYCDTLVVGGNTNCTANFAYSNPTQGKFQFEAEYFSPTANFTWDLGDGTIETGSPAVDHIYRANGGYLVCLTVEDSVNNCFDQYCDTVFVGGRPVCSADFAYATLPNGGYQFEAEYFSPSAVFTWDLGDGTIEVGGPSVDHIYGANGTYLVCLTVVDTLNSCFKQYCDSVVVGGSPNCTAEFESAPMPILSGGYVFEAKYRSPFATYKWEFGDGTTERGSPVVDHVYPATGTYWVCLFVEDTVNNCFDQYCDTVIVGGSPGCSADFEVGRLAADKFVFESKYRSSTATYSWDFDDGNTGSGKVVDHKFGAPGIYVVCLVVEDSINNCRDQVCIPIQVQGNANCFAKFEDLVMTNGVIQFLNLSQGDRPNGNRYRSFWDFGDGTTSNARNPLHRFAQTADSFYVCLKITSSNTCADTFCAWVFPEHDSTMLGCDAAFDAHATGGGIVAFNSLCPSPNLTYHWDFGDGSTDNSAAPVHTYANPGTYLVCLEVKDTLINCHQTFCDSVYVGGGGGTCQVVADFSYRDRGNGTIDFVELSSSAGIPGSNLGLSFFWEFGDSTTSTDPNPTHTFNGPGPYQVCLTVKDPSGNCVASICQTVGTTNPNSGYHLSGGVVADNQMILNGVVYLIQHDTTSAGGTLTAVDSVYMRQSFYTFFNVQPGTYLVKAALLPASPFYYDFLPTYLGDELLWNNATSVIVTNQNQVLPFINMVKGNNPGGPGFIGGLISQGANKNQDGLPDVSVLLLDDQGNAITHTTSDKEGNYQFANLPLGTYHLYVEIPGKLSEKWIVVLDGQDVEFTKADFQVMDYEVLAGGTTPINELSVGKLLNFYPNPTQGKIQVEVELAEPVELMISVRNLLGQKMIEKPLAQFLGQQKVELDLTAIENGTYLLVIEAEGESIHRLIVKK